MLARIRFATIDEFLCECARTFGVHGAAAPFPRWWPGFDLWYVAVGQRRGSRGLCIQEANTDAGAGLEWVEDLIEDYEKLRARASFREDGGRTSAWVSLRRPRGPELSA